MMQKRKLDTDAVVAVPAVASVTALAFFVVLWLVSQPSHLAQRIARINQQTAQAEALLAHGPTHGPYGISAVCQDANAAPGMVRQTLQSAAAAQGLTLTHVSTAQGAPNEAIGGLGPIALAFEASGRYDAVMGLLGVMAQSQPQIFADTVDLKSQLSSVSLTFTGRLFCSTTARL